MILQWHSKHFISKSLFGSNILPLFVALFITGCSGTSAPLTYYLLHPTNKLPTHASIKNSDAQPLSAQVVTLDKILLPEYLKHRGLVYQTSDTNLHISTSHLWGESIEEGIAKTLKQSLAESGIQLVQHDVFNEESTVHLSLYISDFITTYSGDIYLSGEYTFTSEKDAPKYRAFALQIPLTQDGFAASVKAKREVLKQLASDIAHNVKNGA
ncbi:membrane integrity-associated transporter subunit PqiC [Alteromonas sp. D210916BOD_24]|uniref:PqiC family protein n=1 Tax=Alteromonas sp. D210916BOD_24 TaxID=3157618 RepID=UPI00399D05C8